MIRVTFPDGYEDRGDDDACRPDPHSDFESAIHLYRGSSVEVKRGDIWDDCHVETFEEQIARLTAERDAAEKRLADLRAWAEEQRKWARFAGYDAYAEVVQRIDRKDGESK